MTEPSHIYRADLAAALDSIAIDVTPDLVSVTVTGDWVETIRYAGTDAVTGAPALITTRIEIR
jgi:hypothetical protein